VSPRTGRRAGPSRTREAILEAASRRFANHGYDRATIRAIAADAGVDPALLRHFFGSKEGLFVAAMRLPATPGQLLADLSVRAGRDRSALGETLIRTVLGVWDTPEGRAAVLGLLRSAVSSEQAAGMLREFVRRAILGRIMAALDTPDAAYRTSLVASQIVGLAVTRYVVRLEPIASASQEDLVVAIGPTLQRYLTGEL
jgi:AcrR family transcriptional regulator